MSDCVNTEDVDELLKNLNKKSKIMILLITSCSMSSSLHNLFSLFLISVAICSAESLKLFGRIPILQNHQIRNNYSHILHSQISDVGRGGGGGIGNNHSQNSFVTEFTISSNDNAIEDEINITRYKTISRISLHLDMRKDNEIEDELPTMIPNFMETNNVETRSFQYEQERLNDMILSIINFIMEKDNEIYKDLICAYHMNNDFSSATLSEPILVKGALGYFESSANNNDEIPKKAAVAECMGCISDLIILSLSPFEGYDSEQTKTRQLSDVETKIILNRLINGIKRKIHSKSDSLSSMQTTSTITTLWIHSLAVDKKTAQTMEDKVYDKIIQQLHQSNIKDHQSLIHINRSSHIFKNTTNVREKTDNHLLRNIPHLKTDEEHENDLPLALLPALIQNICLSFLQNEDENTSEKHAKQFISFKKELTMKLRKGNDCNDRIAKEKSSDILKSEFKSRLHQATMAVRRKVERSLSILEVKQNESILRGGMPILEFGKDASNILKTVNKEFDNLIESISKSENQDFVKRCKKMIQERQMEILLDISYGAIINESSSSSSLKGSITNIQTLYNNQLSALREYYGRKFDEFLDDNEIEGETNINNNAIAQQCAEGFKTAAMYGIPKLCQYDQMLHYDKIKDYKKVLSDNEIVAFDFLPALQGLLKDMMSSLESRNILEEDWASAVEKSDEDTDDDGHYPKRKQRTWYEKLAARLLIMGVNYGQGWLALQVIKKAAAERDRNMPKFPLF